MSQAFTVAAIAGLIAGGAGAFATTSLLGDRSAPEAQDADPALALEQLAATNKTLASRLEDMTSRLESLERKSKVPTLAAEGGGAPTRAEVVDEGLYITRAELDELLKEKASRDLKVVNPAAMATVEAVLDLREERREQEREVRRAEERTKRTEDRLARMQTELGLDQTQMDSLRTIYSDRDAKFDELRQQMRDARETGSMDGVNPREMFRELQEESTEAVRGVLTPQQMETYEENGYDNPWGRRGGRGGGGNATGGGGNGGGGAARGGGGGGRRRGF